MSRAVLCRSPLVRSFVVRAGATLLLALVAGEAWASLPSSYTHRQRYIEADGSYSYWSSGTETYVKSTLPHEWYASWASETLKAGAVIIRSGVYWRVNRSVNGSSWPNNNCYHGTSGTLTWYVTVPNSRGGYEEWHPNSGVASTNSATDATYRYHADRVSLPAGRPDRFVGLRYNSTVQNRTNSGSGTWTQKIRYAVVGLGAPFDPNQQCSQEDDQTSTDPAYNNT